MGAGWLGGEGRWGGGVSGLPGTVYLNITLLWRHVKYIFFPQHLLMHKMCLTLERESSARKNKKHCMVFALEGAGKASKPEAIKDGNQQAKATDANEVT